MTISPRNCEPCQSCQCTPALIHTWRGNPTWSDNVLENIAGGPPFANAIDPRRIAGTGYQWRIAYDWENIAAERERILAKWQPPLSSGFSGYISTIAGGPLRDGLLIGLPGTNGSPVAIDFEQFQRGGVQWPWRLEAGCVRCRCRHGRSIYWPIRHDADFDYTVAPNGAVTINSFDRVRDADDYGRAMTTDEITRDLWYGGGPTVSQITLTNARRCPPTEIIWSHRHTLNNITNGTPPQMSALTQRRDDYTQTALGWLSDGPTLSNLGPPSTPFSYTGTSAATQHRERFDTVDLATVNRITLVQPATYEPHVIAQVQSGIVWKPPNADPSTITDDEIDALIDWLDNGPPRLLTISGCADTLGTINGFLARFCSLRWEEYAQTNHPAPPIPGITLIDDTNADPHFFQNPRFVPTGHEYAGTVTVYTSRVPKAWDQWFYPGVSGGETLYEIEYELGPAGNPQTLRFPAVAMETRANGSRIVFAPQFRVWSPTNRNANILQADEVQTDSPYFAANRNPLDRLGWLGTHTAALLAQHPPTIPQNASLTG